VQGYGPLKGCNIGLVCRDSYEDWVFFGANLRSLEGMKHEACFGQHLSTYGVATVNRIDQIIGLFCRILSLLQGSFARETFNLFDPTNQSHPIGLFCGRIRGLEWTNMGFVCRDIYEYSSLLRKYKGFE